MQKIIVRIILIAENIKIILTIQIPPLKTESSLRKPLTSRMKKLRSMQYCLSTRIRSQAARSIRAGTGSAIGKIFPKAKFDIDKSQIRALI